ncbi:MAG TPA: diguanylate cyclase [Rhizobacter sp.]
MGKAVRTRVSTLVLGHEARQRLRASQALMVVLVDVLLSFVCAFGVWTGLIDARLALAWSSLTLLGVLGFYAVIRSGWNLRLASADPALTLPQGVFSIFSTLGAYLICGPVRGASLLAMAITLVCGMFALKPGQVQRLSVFSVLLLGATMVGAHLRWPERFPIAEEALHFMMIAVVLPTIAVLAGQLSTMRHKLRQHRLDLEQALEHNRQLAIRDELTGLYNRRHVMELMDKEAQRAQRNGQPLAIALLDIDHFKRINDSCGHTQGDEVLKAFALAVGATVRDTDVLGRWGGEEFMVVLPDTDAAGAERVLARVHASVGGVSFPCGHESRGVSFSAGIAAAAPGEPLHATIERADSALYRAKDAGRHCSVVADTPDATALARAARPVTSCVP